MNDLKIKDQIIVKGTNETGKIISKNVKQGLTKRIVEYEIKLENPTRYQKLRQEDIIKNHLKLNRNQLEKIKKGDNFNLNFNEKKFSFNKTKDGSLIIFYENEKDLKKLFKEIPEAYFNEIADADFIKGKKSNNKPLKQKITKVKTNKPLNMNKPVKVTQHKRNTGSLVRKHTRNKPTKNKLKKTL